MIAVREKNPPDYNRRRRESSSSNEDDVPVVRPFSGEFYNDNKRIPIFLREKKAFSTEEILQVLFSATNDDVKCTEPQSKFR